MNPLGPIERELKGDGYTTRMSADVCASNVEMVEQAGGVRGVLND